jgi:rSAM/selenodomain-associated transferase 1
MEKPVRMPNMSQLKDALQPRVRRKFSQPNRVIVFTRHPEAGVTKTRLIPALGPELASRVQTELTKRTLDVAQRHCAGKPCDVEVRFAGGDRLHMESQFGLDKRYRRQGEGDLGARLAGVFETAFAEGAQRVLVTGADCPGLKPSILNTAIEALSEADVVLGPAFDGGYYLVGLHSPNPSLFAGIDWGTGQVLTQTIQRATAAGLSVNVSHRTNFE